MSTSGTTVKGTSSPLVVRGQESRRDGQLSPWPLRGTSSWRHRLRSRIPPRFTKRIPSMFRHGRCGDGRRNSETALPSPINHSQRSVCSYEDHRSSEPIPSIVERYPRPTSPFRSTPSSAALRNDTLRGTTGFPETGPGRIAARLPRNRTLRVSRLNVGGRTKVDRGVGRAQLRPRRARKHVTTRMVTTQWHRE